jgi:2-polyprenyl-3-methyl-5-hydroxy-6-metoxy-1,4-benzoquinol methylase
MSNKRKEIINRQFGFWQVLQLLTEISEKEEVREGRFDPEFKDFQRYVADTRYILKALKEKSKVLDVGAGAGVFSIALARLGFDVTATDLVPEGTPELHFFRKFGCAFVPTNLDEGRLPFSNEAFDAILCLHVIEHLRKPLLALVEFKRVLRPGGTLILMTPNGIITSIYKKLLPDKNLQITGGHIQEYTPRELAHMLMFSGFEICDIAYSNELVSANLLYIPQRIKRLLVRGYCFFCNLLPAISYEIHITAKAEETK